MDVIKLYYDESIDLRSPIQKDYQRVVHHDEKGEEIVTYEEFDASKAQKALGPVQNWTLENLLKAGINPDMNIHTGFNTRIEGFNTIENMTNTADNILAENTDEK